MTTKQLLDGLWRIAKGSHYCYGCRYEQSCNLCGCAVIRQAIKQIAEKEALEQERDSLKARLERANDDQRRREALLYPELKWVREREDDT